MHKLLIGVAFASILIVAPVDSSIALTGSYSQTCFACNIYDGAPPGVRTPRVRLAYKTLVCKCQRISGDYVNSSIIYTSCPNQSVQNRNGQLVCGP
jgi:hypothetical protein